jgi:hypothetical protein
VEVIRRDPRSARPEGASENQTADHVYVVPSPGKPLDLWIPFDAPTVEKN